MLSYAGPPVCLVAEDEALIAMALEAILEEAGFRVAGPFMNNKAALAWLDGHAPDLALLDVLLRDGPCMPIVHVLRARNVPFAVCSGLKAGSRPSDLAAVCWLEKPVARDDLVKRLWEMAKPSTFSAQSPGAPLAQEPRA